MNADPETEILLVEDNPFDAELTIREFRRHDLGNKLVHVKDGAGALDFVFGTGAYAGRDPTRHPRVVLLDMKLPKVDGLQVLQAIKTDEHTRTIPVVVMITSEEQREVIVSYQLGVIGYVAKPVKFDQFCNAVSVLGCDWRSPGSRRQHEQERNAAGRGT
jgi:CheY-like chemotaxis protein